MIKVHDETSNLRRMMVYGTSSGTLVMKERLLRRIVSSVCWIC